MNESSPSDRVEETAEIERSRSHRKSVRPLRLRNAEGEAYRRHAEVEAQIEATLSLTTDDLIARARIADYRNTERLKDETLVYYLREGLRELDRIRADALARELAARCERTIRRRVSGSINAQFAEDCAADALSDAAMVVFDLERDASDFAEVRFRVFLDRRISDARDRYLKQQNISARTTSLDAESDKGSYDEPESMEASPQTLAESREGLRHLREGLRQLDEPIRTAFILRHYRGWQIEANDANEPSISRHFNVTDRTVRNWLKRAERDLKAWRERLGAKGETR